MLVVEGMAKRIKEYENLSAVDVRSIVAQTMERSPAF